MTFVTMSSVDITYSKASSPKYTTNLGSTEKSSVNYPVDVKDKADIQTQLMVQNGHSLNLLVPGACSLPQTLNSILVRKP